MSETELNAADSTGVSGLGAMKQALEALEEVTRALLATRDALAERGARPETNAVHQGLWDSSFEVYTDRAIPAAQALRLAIEQAEKQEPFVVKHYSGDERPIIKGNGFDGLEIGQDREEAQAFADWVNARLAPPQRQPLTDAEIKAVIRAGEYDTMEEFARAIERKHGIGGEHE